MLKTFNGIVNDAVADEIIRLIARDGYVKPKILDYLIEYVKDLGMITSHKSDEAINLIAKNVIADIARGFVKRQDLDWLMEKIREFRARRPESLTE